jgi:GNAT superfamily N-acetyltransferase
LSWFGRGRERRELDGVTVFVGQHAAVLAFPETGADLPGAVALARAGGVGEVGCWALEPDDELGARLTALGFQDGWQPHWMGVDPRELREEPAHRVEESSECSRELPYWSEAHEHAGGDAHHFVARAGSTLVGHTVLNVDGESAGLYDMGVLPRARRRGYGRALTIAALARARDLSCASVTLNATAEGELLYRSVGFRSLGLGMTWWLFPG